MISTRKPTQLLQQAMRYNKITWNSGNPYNLRWQSKWRPAYYTYLKDNFEPTHVGKPEDSKTTLPLFYSYWQDILLRVFPSFKNIYSRSERFQDPFQIYVLPSMSIFFFQFWDLSWGFQGLTLLPWMLFWTRLRDKTVDPDYSEIHLRDIVHQNAEIGELFKPESIHLMDYDMQYDEGFPCEKKFPEFKNKFFRFFNNDSHMCTGVFKFGDLESGATMTLNVFFKLFRSKQCPSMENGDIR